MDPDVTYATALDDTADPADRHDAARDLLTWLYGGGFMPQLWSGRRDELTLMLRGIRDSTAPAPTDTPIPFDPQPNR